MYKLLIFLLSFSISTFITNIYKSKPLIKTEKEIHSTWNKDTQQLDCYTIVYTGAYGQLQLAKPEDCKRKTEPVLFHSTGTTFSKFKVAKGN